MQTPKTRIRSFTLFNRKQTGQSMVEYVVILSALTLAVLAVGDGDFSTPEDGNVPEVLQAVQGKYQGYSHAVSLTEYPETDDLIELADYYDSLGKYPELASDMRAGASTIEAFVDNYVNVTSALENFNPSLPDDFEDIDVWQFMSGFL